MAKKDVAIAIPTKKFFVSMLTRDISLSDAILDLIDNCLDGALRLANGKEVDYSQHSINIGLSSKEFVIEDDCGGIPRDIAKNYAFKMGREPGDKRDSKSETIGMYGVGMKRAIFKMGRDALVSTLCKKDGFQVPISSAWLDSTEWSPLPIQSTIPNAILSKPGTLIKVKKLYPSVSKHFQNNAFINELSTSIGEHFTIFLQKGLKITINGSLVKPVRIEVLVSDDSKGPAPYVYQKEIQGVKVSITVGLNTGRGFDDDDEEVSDFERNRSAETAGWTVFCNDRAVIVGDKSRVTGWGDGIPLYHYQFSVITGIIEFRSTIADKLPITTTKRALDTSSDIWLEARTKMREGLRIFINHTNTWKNHPRSDQAIYWKSAKPMPINQAVETVTKRLVTRKKDGGVEYNPIKKGVLPEPDTKKPSSRRIVYSRPLKEIQVVSLSLFDKDDEKPGIVGDKCFQEVLDDVLKQEKGK